MALHRLGGSEGISFNQNGQMWSADAFGCYLLA